MNKKLIIIILITAAILFAGLGAYVYFANKNQTNPTPYSPPSEKKEELVPPKEAEKEVMAAPISDPKSRITKKPFGKYVTPENSPVSPEKFTGYHTAVDFEAKENEQNTPVDILSICDGKVIEKSEVQGYGGLIIQDCTIKGEKATVLYGHVNINGENIPKIGDELKRGQKITTLADPFSRFSGDERKHLHLGIHKGTNIEYLGYVQDQNRLNEWINIEPLI